MEDKQKRELVEAFTDIAETDYEDQMDSAENVKIKIKGLSETYNIPTKILRKFVVTYYKNNKKEQEDEQNIIDELWETLKS